MKISILITSKIQFHTAQFYIEQFQKKEVAIDLYTYKFIYKDFLQRDWKKINVYFIEDLGVKFKIVKWIHFLLLLFFTSREFSPMYDRWVSQRLKKNIIAFNFFKIFNIFFPKKHKNLVNKNLKEAIARINLNLFKTKTVLNFTTNDQPHLLCQKYLNVITIVESWDHPYKFPIGYVSDKVYVWNEALKMDWQAYQGDFKIEFGYQAKFDYLIGIHKNKDETKKLNNFMYPFSTSSHSDILLYNDEFRFVEQLARVLSIKGKTLFIKPKPSTPFGELDYFQKFPGIKILSYQKSIDGANYSLSESYNKNRIKEMNKVDIILSRGTTFVFDAAIYGKPVVLFNFKTEYFPALSKLNDFPHLSRHLFSKEENIITIHNRSSIKSQIENLLDLDIIELGNSFSKYLNSWIQIDSSLNNIVFCSNKIMEEL